VRIPYPLSYPRWLELRWSFRLVLALPFIGALIITAPVFYAAGMALGDALEIPHDAPVRDHPDALPFMSVLFASILGWVLLCWFAAVAMVAVLLCARGTLSRTEAWTLVRTGRCPDDWYVTGGEAT
jgi:hypothetical protein